MDEEIDNVGPYCEVCGAELEWEECYEIGCDEGFYDGYEDDPLWFDQGDMVPCETCGGRGGWWICPDAKNHPKEEG